MYQQHRQFEDELRDGPSQQQFPFEGTKATHQEHAPTGKSDLPWHASIDEYSFISLLTT